MEKENTVILENPKIYAAIAGVIADVGAVAKDKVNKQQGFKFRSIDDVYNALHPALAKNKVFIVPRILEQTREIAGTTKNGAKIMQVICKIKFTFYAEDGSNIDCIIIGEGMDMGDKATNKAMAIAYKYACFQVFCIPTEEMTDPDAESLEPQNKAQNQTAAKEETTKKKSTPTKESQKQEAPAKEEPKNDEPAEEEKITQAMVNTIRSEQKRTGVADDQILGRKAVKAKCIEEMNITEFKSIMEVFKKTPDLKKGGENE